MRTLVITPPAPLLMFEDVAPQLGLGDDETDAALVNTYIAAVSAHIDGPDGILGRAIGPQVLEARLDGFDIGLPLVLACPPVTAINAINYTDPNGASLPLAAYQAFADTIEPAYGTSWPATRWGRETVRVQYQAGYPVLPPAIKAVVLMMVTDLYENRGTTLDARAAGAVAVPMSPTVDKLLSPFVVRR